MSSRSVQIIGGSGRNVANVDADTNSLQTTIVGPVDGLNDAVTVQSEIHSKIHAGRFFVVSRLNTSVANNASLDFLVRTNGDPLHARFIAAVAAQCYAYVYEGPTFSAAGTAVTPVNKNRTSANTTAALFSYAPTITTLGTLLSSAVMPGGSRQQAAGSTQATFEEWMLDSSKNYLVRITNSSGGAIPISIQCDFYVGTP